MPLKLIHGSVQSERCHLSALVAVGLVLGFFFGLSPRVEAGLTSTATSWSNFSSPGYIQSYTQGGVTTTDNETASDPTTGGAAPNPCTLDLGSEGDPGASATEHYGYYDGGTTYNPADASTYQDDYVFFRMRIVCDPRRNTTVGSGFVGNDYNILIDVDNDGYKEFWVDLKGNYHSTSVDAVKILYEDANRQDFPTAPNAGVCTVGGVLVDCYAADHSETYDCDAGAPVNNCSHTRVIDLGGSTEWWIEIQVPLTAFHDANGNQKVFPNSTIAFAYSTSASNTDPLQKDWSRDFQPTSTTYTPTDPIVFGDPVILNGEGKIVFKESNFVLEASTVTIGNQIYVLLTDQGLNTSSGSAQTVVVQVQDLVTGDTELITLTETGNDTGTFTNAGDTLPTSASSGGSLDDGTLLTGNGNEIKVTYTDASDGDVDPDNNTKSDTINAVSNGSCFEQFTRLTGLDVTEYLLGDNVYVTVTDSSRNTSAVTAQTFTVTVTSGLSGDSESVTLTETGVDTGVFRNTTAVTMPTWNGTAIVCPAGALCNNGAISSLDFDTLTASYVDGADTCTDTALVREGTGNAGRVRFVNSTGTLDVNVVVGGEDIYIEVADVNANTNAATAQTLSVTVTSSITGDSVTITLTETGVNTGLFRNTTALPSQFDLTPDTAGTLEIGDFDTLTASYVDASDGDAVAANNTKTDTALGVGAPVLIDSAIYDPCTTGRFHSFESVTLTNPTDVNQDITGWRITDTDATLNYTIPQLGGSNVVMGPGTTALFLFKDGTSYLQNGIYVFYIGASFDGTLDNTADQVTLYNASNGVVDFFAWDTTTTHGADWSADDTTAVDVAKWDDQNFVDAASAPANCYAVQRDSPDLDTNEPSDFGFINLNALAVELFDFSATPYQDAVLLEWETATEIDNLGFNVYRSDAFDGPYVQVNASLIYGLLTTPVGGRYYFIDSSVEVGKTYYYLLEDLEVDGAAAQHGPLTVTTADSQPLFDDSGWTPLDYVNGGASGEGDSGNVGDGDQPPDDSDALTISEVADGDGGLKWIITFTPEAPNLTSYVRPEDGKTYWQALVPSYPGSGAACAPELPARRFLIPVPERTVTAQLLEVDIGESALGVGELMQPVPQYTAVLDVEGNPESLTPTFCFDAAVYAATSWLPETMFEWQGAQRLGGENVAQLLIQPVQYLPQQHALRYATRIVVELTFSHEESVAGGAPPLADIAALETQFALTHDAQSLKIRFADTGLYRLDYDDLLAAGFNVNAAPASFQIFAQGREQAIEVVGGGDGSFDVGDQILFYGQKNATEQSERLNTYWLRQGQGAGLRMEHVDVSPVGNGDASAAAYFWDVLPLEENHTYYPSAPEDSDHWFWAYGVPGLPGFEWPTVQFSVTGIATSTPTQSTLTVKFLGVLPNSSQTIDVYLNNQLIGTHNLSGTEVSESQIAFSSAFLLEGVNEIRLEQDAPAYFNGLSLIYPKQYEAAQDALKFSTPIFGDYVVTGYSTAELYLVETTDPEKPLYLENFVTEPGDAAFNLRFQSPDVPFGASITAEALAAMQIPEALILNTPSDLGDTANRADYVILTPAVFTDAIERLAEHRRRDGYAVMVIDVERVYDAFGFGVLRPEAIRSFLHYATTHWQEKPEYVLLVGDATYDYKNYLGPIEQNNNFIPIPLVQTDFHETGSDAYYAQLDQDIYPEVALGRLPVNTLEELERQIDRIIAYETTPFTESWQRRIDLAVDDVDNAANDHYFGEYADEITAKVEGTFVTQRISEATEGSVAQTHQAILDAFNEGSLVINWLGHGAIPIWASESLLQRSDLPAIQNETHLPIVIATNCLNAQHYRTGNSLISLSEAMVNSPTGGAIAYWSTTALTPPQAQFRLNLAFYNGLMNSVGATPNGQSTRPPRTLGKIILNASHELPATMLGAPDVLKAWALHGDPALRIPVPAEPNSGGGIATNNGGGSAESGGGCRAVPGSNNLLSLWLSLIGFAVLLMILRHRTAQKA